MNKIDKLRMCGLMAKVSSGFGGNVVNGVIVDMQQRKKLPSFIRICHAVNMKAISIHQCTKMCNGVEMVRV